MTRQLEFRDIRQIPTNGTDTSGMAARSLEPFVTGLRRRVHDFLRLRGAIGATCDEAEDALRLSHQTCSARLRELAREGYVTVTDDRRPTRTGRAARVYVVSA